MRLTMSREAPTRSAISCCVSLSGICELAVAVSTAMLSSSARHAPVHVEQRQVLHAVGGEPRAVDDLGDHVEREVRVARGSPRGSGSRATTENVVGSSVMHRGRARVAVERHLAHVLARALRIEDHLVALGVRHEDLHLAGEDHEDRVARVALGDEHRVLGIAAHAPERASCLTNGVDNALKLRGARAYSLSSFFSGSRGCL